MYTHCEKANKNPPVFPKVGVAGGGKKDGGSRAD